jgi:hypothetical protein
MWAASPETKHRPTCMVGSARCWMVNFDAQLGDSTTVSRPRACDSFVLNSPAICCLVAVEAVALRDCCSVDSVTGLQFAQDRADVNACRLWAHVKKLSDLGVGAPVDE